MYLNLFSFAWREAIRSAFWGKSLATNIGLGLLAIYFMVSFLFLGFALPDIMTKGFPNADPVNKFNSILLGYFAIEQIIRQLMQKLPTVSFKPFLLLNIRRSKIVNYLMVRSLINFFNILPIFLLVPLAFNLVGVSHSGLATASWFLAIFILVFSNHFLAIYLKWKFNETQYGFFILLALLVALFAINYYGVVDFSKALGKLLDLVLIYPALSLLFILLPVLLYGLNFKFLISRMFLNLFSGKQKEIKVSDYSWLNKMGDTGRFIAL